MATGSPISLWYGVVNYTPSLYQHCWQQLDANSQQRAQHIKNPSLQQRHVIIHGQVRQILANLLQQSPQLLTITTNSYGKPYLVNHPQLAFNLSHTGNVFVLALAWHCQVGIDVERSDHPRDQLTGLVQKCFAKEEADYWQQLPAHQQLASFYQFWTRKEAFVKATGFGISLGLQRCVINPIQPDTLLRIPSQCGQANDWHLQSVTLPDPLLPLCISVCSNQAIPTISLYRCYG
jgi:4'-phosphopantetheinyl transferase